MNAYQLLRLVRTGADFAAVNYRAGDRQGVVASALRNTRRDLDAACRALGLGECGHADRAADRCHDRCLGCGVPVLVVPVETAAPYGVTDEDVEVSGATYELHVPGDTYDGDGVRAALEVFLRRRLAERRGGPSAGSGGEGGWTQGDAYRAVGQLSDAFGGRIEFHGLTIYSQYVEVQLSCRSQGDQLGHLREAAGRFDATPREKHPSRDDEPGIYLTVPVTVSGVAVHLWCWLKEPAAVAEARAWIAEATR